MTPLKWGERRRVCSQFHDIFWKKLRLKKASKRRITTVISGDVLLIENRNMSNKQPHLLSETIVVITLLIAVTDFVRDVSLCSVMVCGVSAGVRFVRGSWRIAITGVELG